MVHLKRFDNRQRKIKKFLKYEKCLQLNKYSSKGGRDQITYKLSSVLIHDGHSIYSGHYYCHVRVSDDTWYCFNDQSVQKVDESVVLNQTPYILFYEKVIDKSRLKLSSRASKQSAPNRPGQIPIKRNPNKKVFGRASNRSSSLSNPINQIDEIEKKVSINNYLRRISTRRNVYCYNKDLNL